MQKKGRLLLIIIATILLGGIIISSCKSSDNEKVQIKTEDTRVTYTIVIIDSCEYISFSPGYQDGLLTHKGNCKFCTQRLKNLLYAYSISACSNDSILRTSTKR